MKTRTVRGREAWVGNGRRLEEAPRLLNLAAAALDGAQRGEQLGLVRLRREGRVQQRARALVEPARVGKRSDQIQGMESQGNRSRFKAKKCRVGQSKGHI